VAKSRNETNPLHRTNPAETAEDETIRGTEGKWVLVVDGRVVASSDSIKEVFRAAAKYPPERSVVTRILHGGASFY